MSHGSPGIVVAALLVVVAAIMGTLGYQSMAPSTSTAASPIDADGAVPAGTTIFDDEVPAVANLDPALLAPLRRAATDAADDGVELFVASGWRSPEYQELCRIYGNEPWHYGLRPEAVDRGCPAMYADPTHDPRMQQ